MQKLSGTAQVRAQVAGKDDAIANLKSHTLYHRNHAPTIALTTSGILVKSYTGIFSANVVNVTDWGAGDGAQTGTFQVQPFALTDSQIVTNLMIDSTGTLRGSLPRDTSMIIKIRIRAKDNGGTDHGGVDSSAWSAWLPIQVVDTVMDPQANIYRAVRMPDGKVWMRSNMRQTVKTVPPPDIDTFPCFQNDCASYGVLYTDVQAFTYGATYDPTLRNAPSRAICPSGWHMASRKEWNDLFVATMDPGSSDSLRNLMSDTAWTVYVAKPSPKRESIGGANKYQSFLLPSLNSDPTHGLGADISFYWMPAESGIPYGASLLSSSGFSYYRASVRCLLDQN